MGKQTSRSLRKSRRNIIKGPKSAWIYFCNDTRSKILTQNPGIPFGDVCKKLSPIWSELPQETKDTYIQKCNTDKARFDKEKGNLTMEQNKVLRQIKRKKRKDRKSQPKGRISAYMFFVNAERPRVVELNRDCSFVEIGKKLGEEWNSLSMQSKHKYFELSRNDKKRYEMEMKQYLETKKKKYQE